MTYLLIKTLHILSAFVLFGTGLGSAFYKFMADRRGQIEHIAIINRQVVLADWIFTTPTIIIQPLTGFWLLSLANIPITTTWLSISLGLYVLAGVCWIPVVILQIKMQKMAELALVNHTPLPAKYWQYVRYWLLLGAVAFVAILVVIFLMVVKP